MKRLYLLVLVFLTTLHGFGQVMHPVWNRLISGNACQSWASNAVSTLDGGCIIAGGTSCHPGGDIPAPANGFNKILVTKFTHGYQPDWIKAYGGNDNEYGYAVCRAYDDGFVVAAFTKSTDLPGYKGYWDIYVLRLDKDGNKVWGNCFGGPGTEQPIAICQAPDSGCLVLAYSNGAGGDVPMHYAPSAWDWLLIKIDKDGNKQWAKIFGGSQDELSGKILAAGDGYYLLGSSASRDHDCADTAGRPASIGIGSYMLKIDMQGNLVWGKDIGQPGAMNIWDACWNIKDSSLTIAGTIDAGGQYTHRRDMRIINVSRAGQVNWDERILTDDDETNLVINYANSGDLLLAAYGDWHTNTPTPHGSGGVDAWIYMLDNSGHVANSRSLTGRNGAGSGPVGIFSYNDGVAVASTAAGQYPGFNTIGYRNSPGLGLSYYTYFPAEVRSGGSTNTDLILYPNPAKEVIRLKAAKLLAGTVAIYDNTGDQVYSATANGDASEIDIAVDNLPVGIYHLVFRDEVVSRAINFVKE